MAVLTTNQYNPGGVFKQVSDAAPTGGGPTTTYNQYAAGGSMQQLIAVCANPVVNQYAAGGIWPPIIAGAA